MILIFQGAFISQLSLFSTLDILCLFLTVSGGEVCSTWFFGVCILINEFRFTHFLQF